MWRIFKEIGNHVSLCNNKISGPDVSTTGHPLMPLSVEEFLSDWKKRSKLLHDTDLTQCLISIISQSGAVSRQHLLNVKFRNQQRNWRRWATKWLWGECFRTTTVESLSVCIIIIRGNEWWWWSTGMHYRFPLISCDHSLGWLPSHRGWQLRLQQENGNKDSPMRILSSESPNDQRDPFSEDPE